MGNFISLYRFKIILKIALKKDNKTKDRVLHSYEYWIQNKFYYNLKKNCIKENYYSAYDHMSNESENDTILKFKILLVLFFSMCI